MTKAAEVAYWPAAAARVAAPVSAQGRGLVQALALGPELVPARVLEQGLARAPERAPSRPEPVTNCLHLRRSP